MPYLVAEIFVLLLLALALGLVLGNWMWRRGGAKVNKAEYDALLESRTSQSSTLVKLERELETSRRDRDDARERVHALTAEREGALQALAEIDLDRRVLNERAAAFREREQQHDKAIVELTQHGEELASRVQELTATPDADVIHLRTVVPVSHDDDTDHHEALAALQGRIAELTSERDEARMELHRLRAELDAVAAFDPQVDHGDHEQVAEAAAAALKERVAVLERALQDERAKADSQLRQAVNAADQELRAEQQRAQRDLTRERTQAEQELADALTAIDEERVRAELEVAEATAAVRAELGETLATIVAERDEAEQATQELAVRLDRASEDLDRALDDRDTALEELQRLHGEYDAIAAEGERLRTEIADLHRHRAELTAQLDEAQQLLTAEEERAGVLTDERESARTELATVTAAHSAAERELATARDQLHHLEVRAAAAEGQVDDAHETLRRAEERVLDLEAQLMSSERARHDVEEQAHANAQTAREARRALIDHVNRSSRATSRDPISLGSSGSASSAARVRSQDPTRSSPWRPGSSSVSHERTDDDVMPLHEYDLDVAPRTALPRGLRDIVTDVSTERATTTAADPIRITGSSTGADDLTRISGVGPVLQRKLQMQGITTFAQIATLSEAEIDELHSKLHGFPERIRTDDWVGQARALLSRDGLA